LSKTTVFLFIFTSYEDNLDGVGNLTQMDTTLHFMNSFQLWFLLVHNMLPIDVWKIGTENSMG
jgi:hypothetical protein